MFYLLPPAGTPISIDILMKSFISLISSTKSEESLEEKLEKYLQVKHCLLFDSGRTSLYFILKALSKLKENKRKEIIIPAYTCFSIPAAIVKAGLKIRLVDIDLSSLDYNYEELHKQDFSNVLAIIGCNLFGIQSDWNKLCEKANLNDVFLIDDAAQALGSVLNNKLAGSFGDVGLFSFDRGKNLSTYSGGGIITNNDEIYNLILTEYKLLSRPSLYITSKKIVNLLLSNIFLNPYFYRIPNMLPFVELGKTIYDESFELKLLSNIQKEIGYFAINYLDDLNKRREKIAYEIIEKLLAYESIIIPSSKSDKKNVYLRLPVLVENNIIRNRLLKLLFENGISASSMYPSTIKDIPEIKNHLVGCENSCKSAEQVVKRLITLPTHAYVDQNDINITVKCFKMEISN